MDPPLDNISLAIYRLESTGSIDEHVAPRTSDENVWRHSNLTQSAIKIELGQNVLVDLRTCRLNSR